MKLLIKAPSNTLCLIDMHRPETLEIGIKTKRKEINERFYMQNLYMKSSIKLQEKFVYHKQRLVFPPPLSHTYYF